MKKLLTVTVLIFVFKGLSAQHYGGFTFTPYAVENNLSFRPDSESSLSNIEGKKITAGFALGYQGLLMPKKRISFSYGLMYSSIYNIGNYDAPREIYDIEGKYLKTATGQRMDMDLIEVPLWWRFNILKDKKWQPYIAVSTTVNYVLNYRYTYFYEDAPQDGQEISSGFLISLDVGVGVNYTSNDWMLTIQPTFGGFEYRRLGVGFTVMKKF
jgi:hypothetical protein